jgi:hypothetical protein
MSGVLAAMASSSTGTINTALPHGSGVNAGTVLWQLNNDGTFTISPGQEGYWVTPASAALASLYEVRVDPTSGSFSGGTNGVYLPLSVTRSWVLADPPPVATTTVTFNVSIREIATGVVKSSQTGLTLEATAV